MHRTVRHSDAAKEFLRTHPHAEEARLTIEFLARGELPERTITPASGDDTFLGLLESGRWIWWHYDGGTVVIDGISDDP